jgi:hypothetical protein
MIIFEEYYGFDLSLAEALSMLAMGYLYVGVFAIARVDRLN